jgi:hypothetical protein
MVPSYEYKLPPRFDPHYLRAILEREFPGALLGWCETPTEIRFDFARELTPAEKAKLDSIMASPPMPVARYAWDALDVDDVEREVGVRPVRLDVDLERDVIIVDFDRPLTPEQEMKLAMALRSQRRFKKILPEKRTIPLSEEAPEKQKQR